MEKKQSSVEWLYERLERMIPRTALYNIDKKQYFEQAKAMHKEEMKESYREGRTDQQSARNKSFYHRNAEQYYNETFGGEQ